MEMSCLVDTNNNNDDPTLYVFCTGPVDAEEFMEEFRVMPWRHLYKIEIRSIDNELLLLHDFMEKYFNEDQITEIQARLEAGLDEASMIVNQKKRKTKSARTEAAIHLDRAAAVSSHGLG